MVEHLFLLQQMLEMPTILVLTKCCPFLYIMSPFPHILFIDIGSKIFNHRLQRCKWSSLTSVHFLHYLNPDRKVKWRQIWSWRRPMVLRLSGDNHVAKFWLQFLILSPNFDLQEIQTWLGDVAGCTVLLKPVLASSCHPFNWLQAKWFFRYLFKVYLRIDTSFKPYNRENPVIHHRNPSHNFFPKSLFALKNIFGNFWSPMSGVLFVWSLVKIKSLFVRSNYFLKASVVECEPEFTNCKPWIFICLIEHWG